MILLYSLLTLLGLALTVRLVTWNSRHALTAGVGTVLAIFSILSGFTIGVYVAPVALLVLAVAIVPHLRPHDQNESSRPPVDPSNIQRNS